MKMKIVLSLLVMLSAALLAAADIQLPAPRKSGGMDLMAALSARKTVRTYKARELSMQQISDLLWAAFGINRSNGKRTAPSAINSQELSLYVFLKSGSYLYNAKANKLVQVNAKDCRKLAGERFASPLALLIVADHSKQVRMKTMAVKKHYAAVDSGCVSQNIYLFCASEGLGTCAVGSVNGDKIRAELKLSKDFFPVLGHPVGYPE